MIKMQVFGTKEIQQKIKAANDDLDMKILHSLNHAVDDCYYGALAYCPVKTGNMYRNIEPHYETTLQPVMEGTVESNAPYSLFVEVGHHTHSGSFVRAQPFLFPSFQSAGNLWKHEIEGLNE